MRTNVHSLLLLVLLGLSRTAAAQNAPNDCSQSAVRAISYLSMPGRPFQAIPTLDGCWIFVSVVGEGPRSERGIAVVQRHKGKAEVKRLLAVKELVTGMTMTHDGRLLIAGTGNGVFFVDSDKLIAGQNPIVGKLATSSSVPSASYLSTTSDDRFLFVSNESGDTISVVKLPMIPKRLMFWSGRPASMRVHRLNMLEHASERLAFGRGTILNAKPLKCQDG